MFSQQEIQEIRKDFPILAEKHPQYQVPLIYLDNAATTQKPLRVIEAMDQYYRKYNANPHRGTHFLSSAATDLYEESRAYIAKLFQAHRISEAILTINTTNAMNTLAYGLGLTHLHQGDVILLSIMEHHANLCPWQFVAEQTGATLRYVYLDDQLQLDREDLRAKLDDKVKLVCLSASSNVIATEPDIKAIIGEVRVQAPEALVIVDGAQYSSHGLFSFRHSGADFFVFSGHKIYGPMGSGVLLGRRELLDSMRPFLYGGDMIETVTEESSTYLEAPGRFEGGTQNVQAVHGLAEALRYVTDLGWEEVRTYGAHLADLAEEGLRGLPHVQVFRAQGEGHKAPLVSFAIEEVHPHDVASLLDQDGIAIRAGHHCAEPLHRYLGVPSTCRASFAIYNTEEEVEKLIDSVSRVRAAMGLE